MAGQHRKGVVQQRANLEDKIAELKLKLDDVRRKERESFGRLCEKVGLMDVAISAADLEAALREVAARFRGTAKRNSRTGAAANGPRASTEGAFGDGT
jgi:hypothetical protein